jgi:hypothetical protein
MSTKAVCRLAVLIAALVVLAVPSAAVAAKPTGGSFTTPLTLEPTLIPGTDVTASGTVTADVTQFRVDENGHVVAVATLSGTATLTSPTLGTATIDVTGTRLVLNATVSANCEQGTLTIVYHGALQLNATVTLTSTTGETYTITLNKTVPLNGTYTFRATTQQQQALVCDIENLLGSQASAKALVDKLNTLLKKL